MLLDGRAWELVSPANKKGALIEQSEHGGQVQAANDGSGITYLAGRNLGEGVVGSKVNSQVLSRRAWWGLAFFRFDVPRSIPENEEPAKKSSTVRWNTSVLLRFVACCRGTAA